MNSNPENYKVYKNDEDNKDKKESLIKRYVVRTIPLALTSTFIAATLIASEKIQMGIFIFSLSFILFVFRDLLQESLPIKSKIIIASLIDLVILSAAYFTLGINRQFYIVLALAAAVSLTMFFPFKK